MTKHYRLVVRIADLAGRPVAPAPLPVHDDLPGGIYTVECIEDGYRRQVAGRDETELAAAVESQAWRA